MDQASTGNERSKSSAPSRPPPSWFDADFPGPGLTLLDLDAALNVPEILPPRTERTRLDLDSSKL
jgi:hypothetical protein